MPFGEEIYVGVGGRTGDTGQKYASTQDDIRQKFTGYQKDSETDLDFAEARMYENRYGRFTAVDPLIASGKSANPQTFNRYAYVGNSPLGRTDRTGLDWIDKITYRTDKDGKVTTIHTPTWDPSRRGKLPSGTVPRGSLPGGSLPPLWTEHAGYIYTINGGDFDGWTAVLDPNSGANAKFDNRADAQFTLDYYNGKISVYDMLARDWTRSTQGNGAPLVESVTSRPQFDFANRVLNPDAVQVSYRVPLLGTQLSLGVSRDFDFLGGVGGSADSSDFTSLMSGKPGFGNFSPLGGLSFQATRIEGPLKTRQERLDFLTRGSVTTGACFLACGGTTTSIPSGVRGYNYGFTPSLSPSAGTSVNYTWRLGNPNRWAFGVTPVNGGNSGP